MATRSARFGAGINGTGVFVVTIAAGETTSGFGVERATASGTAAEVQGAWLAVIAVRTGIAAVFGCLMAANGVVAG